jgi:hypothetical protein
MGAVIMGPRLLDATWDPIRGTGSEDLPCETPVLDPIWGNPLEEPPSGNPLVGRP